MEYGRFITLDFPDEGMILSFSHPDSFIYNLTKWILLQNDKYFLKMYAIIFISLKMSSFIKTIIIAL